MLGDLMSVSLGEKVRKAASLLLSHLEIPFFLWHLHGDEELAFFSRETLIHL